ncbi:MAG: hypothetical protein ACOC4R_01010 [Bacteroidota bacterium]
MASNTEPITIIPESKVKELAQVHEPQCVSIFIPTQREGKEVNENQPQIMLKNSIQDLEKDLDAVGMKPREKEAFLKPLWDLQEDGLFWRHQSDGLAIFRNHNRFEYYTLPVHFDPAYYFNEHFYLLPVMPMFNNDGFFYILSLNLQHVKLYEASAHTIGEIYIEDLVPQRLEDAVGYDYEETTLQNRPAEGHLQNFATHGHGAGKDDIDHEVRTFLYAVNDGLMKILNDQKAPLVLVIDDQHIGEFSRICKYKFLHDDHARVNPRDLDMYKIHELGWDRVKDYFHKHLEQQKKEFNDKSATGYTSDDIYHILPAALDGQIKALFLQKEYDRFGIYDHENRELRLDSEHTYANSSLVNQAAVYTFLNQGKVYQLDADEMPVPGTQINALYRFINPEPADEM